MISFDVVALTDDDYGTKSVNSMAHLNVASFPEDIFKSYFIPYNFKRSLPLFCFGYSYFLLFLRGASGNKATWRRR